MRNYNFFEKQRGMSLIEMLVASALGVVIIMGTTQSMTVMSRSSSLQQSQMDLQETSDLALSYIAMRLRNSVSTPCNQFRSFKGLQVNNLVGGSGSNEMVASDQDVVKALVEGQGIGVTQKSFGFNGLRDAGVGSNTLTTDNINFISATDRLLIDGESGIATDPLAVVTLDIAALFSPLSSDGGKKSSSSQTKYSMYVITDCENMDVFRADREVNATANTTKLSALPGTSFLVNYRSVDSAMVSRMSVSTVGIDNRGRLYDKPMFGAVAGNSLLDDIDLVRALFGVDTSGNGVVDRYISASQLTGLDETSQVVSVELYALVRASAPSPDVPSTYTLSIPDTTKELPDSGGLPMQELTVTDQVMRRVFSKSITLRNKVSL